MKTIAVLAALAALASAGPAAPGYGYNTNWPGNYRLAAPVRREKKSPQQETATAPAIEISLSDLEANPDVAARSITLKKPIIVKKKYGYHLYRDSDEEQAQADPQEKCTKEVKVKLCDAENFSRTSEQMRSADSSSEITDNDMHQSIKLAKEAVENLQKMTQFKNAQHGPDAEIHGDIEVARQALEHIQQNFGNLETINVQTTTLKEAEALRTAPFKAAHADSERMAQWKEAIDNIHKNQEIARNIEGHFGAEEFASIKKTENSHTVAEEIKHNLVHKNAEHESTHEMLTSAASELKESKLLLDAPLKVKEAEELKDLNQATMPLDAKKFNDGTTESHSPINTVNAKEAKSNETPMKSEEFVAKLDNLHVENKESMVKAVDNKDQIKAHNQMVNHEHIKQAKSIELDTVAPLLKTSADKEVSLKAAEHKTMADFDLAPAQSAPVIKIVPLHSEAPVSSWTNNGAEHLVEQKSAWKENNHNMLMKSNDNIELTKEKMITQVPSLAHGKSVDTTSLMKSAQQENLHKNHLGNHMHSHAGNNDFVNEHAMSISNNHMNQMKSANLVAAHNEQHSSHIESTSSLNHMSQTKSAEFNALHKDEKLNNGANTAPMNHEAIEHTTMMKSANMPVLHQVEQKPTNFEKLTLINNKNAEHNAQMKSADMMSKHMEQSVTTEANTEMRESQIINNRQNFHDNSEFQAQGKNWHVDKSTSKSSNMMQDTDFERNAPFHEQSHLFGAQAHASAHASGMMHSGGHGLHGGHFGPMRNQFNQFHNHGLHNNHMFGKADEGDSMVQATSQVNINDVTGKSAMERNNMQWKQKELARGAYGVGAYGGAGGLGGGVIGAGGIGIGGGAGSGPGAVGVFPNAKVGGCAIPLLLSCSPSVVSGSLAKGPSYGAHAYRAGEEFDNRFHNKRDTKKTIDIPANKVKRTPTKVIQKIPIEKKL